ncbi:MAG: GNAT family N-acetyltransferase [Gammaproteobacteria bacterium]|nr:GNAT family N-acetyltransferase [Gammaproteobacteria bacterium]
MLRQADYNDIDSIVDIHLATLSDGLLAKLGKPFLKKVFYPFCFQSSDVLLMVYELQNKITSFVIYTNNSTLFTHRLLQKKVAIGIAVLKNILFNPSLLVDILVVLKGFRVQLHHGYEDILKNNQAELYLIGTEPAFQGQGIGSILVSQGLKEFSKKLNVSTCLVKTSSFKANQFYLANQFTAIGTEYRGKQCFQILCKQTETIE